MTAFKTVTITSLAASLALCSSASAVVLASTSFDGKTLSPSNTANNLGWTVNGLADPGSMAAFNATGGAQAIFNGGDTPNIFTPGINTGNGNTFWTTSVSLTVVGGASVQVTDVTFDSWSINGGQTQNVNRRSDFTLTILDPSNAVVGTVEVADVLSGTAAGVPNVTATFPSAVALSDSGTYTLEIKGGDFVGFNETGNHTGIDNLSINGTIGAVPEPSAILLSSLSLLVLAGRRRR